MFASLPFILLLILQGFARQDCAEFLLGNQDLANVPAQTRSIKAFDGLFVHLSLTGKDKKSNCAQPSKGNSGEQKQVTRFSLTGTCTLQSGFLEVQRSRDGPAA